MPKLVDFTKIDFTKIDFTNPNKQLTSNSVKNLLGGLLTISVNVQVCTISNILMSIQSFSTRIDVIGFAIAILIMQFEAKIK